MRYKILLIPVLVFTVLSLPAQKTNKVFAITGDNTGGSPFIWTNLNEVDLSNGQVTRPLYTHLRTAFDFYDGNTKQKRFGSSWQSNLKTPTPQMPASYVIAAAAYDARHNRMFMTPMQQPELRWIDMDDNTATLKIYTAPLPLSASDIAVESGQITRMVIAADGYGYALTNDAGHLLRFSTGRKIEITDLGAVQDAGSNGAVSVHIKCTSFGGDMVAAADGSLYLISAYQSVFKIDVAAKTAAFIGAIKNLPAGYTTNGAAVNEDGFLIVSTAGPAGGYFRVDMNTWEAVKLTGENKTAGVSDLASSHFAFQKKIPLVPVVFSDMAKQQSHVSVYPNPVTEATFRISFDNKETGRYMVQLMDVNGRLAMQKTINLVYRNQVTEIEMPVSFSKGIYMVKILKADGKAVFTNRMLVN